MLGGWHFIPICAFEGFVEPMDVVRHILCVRDFGPQFGAHANHGVRTYSGGQVDCRS